MHRTEGYAHKQPQLRALIIRLAVVLARQAAAEDDAANRRLRIGADARCGLRSVQ